MIEMLFIVIAVWFGGSMVWFGLEFVFTKPKYDSKACFPIHYELKEARK